MITIISCEYVSSEMHLWVMDEIWTQDAAIWGKQRGHSTCECLKTYTNYTRAHAAFAAIVAHINNTPENVFDMTADD